MLRVSFSPAPGCVDADCSNLSFPTPPRHQEQGYSCCLCDINHSTIYIYIHIYTGLQSFKNNSGIKILMIKCLHYETNFLGTHRHLSDRLSKSPEDFLPFAGV